MAILIVAVFPSRLSRYTDTRASERRRSWGDEASGLFVFRIVGARFDDVILPFKQAFRDLDCSYNNRKTNSYQRHFVGFCSN